MFDVVRGDGGALLVMRNMEGITLKSAIEAKIDVPKETMRKVGGFFEKCGDRTTGKTGYMISNRRESDLTTAVGLIVQEFILHKHNSPFGKKAAAHLEKRARGETGPVVSTVGLFGIQGLGGGGRPSKIGETGDFYTLYNGTLAMFLAGGTSWRECNDNVRDAVIDRQVKTGCARGSWSHVYGLTLDTAWAVLTLEVYYRYAGAKAVAKDPALDVDTPEGKDTP